MNVLWTTRALDDYHHWQKTDSRIVARIDTLIANIKVTPYAGIGKPEPLKYKLSGWWSRRITGEHRLVYCVREGALIIAQCRYHY